MTNNSKSHAKSLGHRTGVGSPITANSSSGRGKNPSKKIKSSSAGLQGLSIGQKVPMQIFQQKYLKPNEHGMGKVQDANRIKKKVKTALAGKQKQFFGL